MPPSAKVGEREYKVQRRWFDREGEVGEAHRTTRGGGNARGRPSSERSATAHPEDHGEGGQRREGRRRRRMAGEGDCGTGRPRWSTVKGQVNLSSGILATMARSGKAHCRTEGGGHVRAAAGREQGSCLPCRWIAGGSGSEGDGKAWREERTAAQKDGAEGRWRRAAAEGRDEYRLPDGMSVARSRRHKERAGQAHRARDEGTVPERPAAGAGEATAADEWDEEPAAGTSDGRRQRRAVGGGEDDGGGRTQRTVYDGERGEVKGQKVTAKLRR